MALRIELWEHGVLTGGVEEWWDDVENVLDDAENKYPILASISPYGELVIAHDRMADLAGESGHLAQITSGKVRALMLKIADLCERALAAPDGELRFDGD